MLRDVTRAQVPCETWFFYPMLHFGLTFWQPRITAHGGCWDLERGGWAKFVLPWMWGYIDTKEERNLLTPLQQPSASGWCPGRAPTRQVHREDLSRGRTTEDEFVHHGQPQTCVRRTDKGSRRSICSGLIRGTYGELFSGADWRRLIH